MNNCLRPPTRPATALAPAGASRRRHHRHGRRPAGGGVQRQPIIHRVRRLTDRRRVSEFLVSGRLLPSVCAPTAYRTSPTPTATGRSLRKLLYARCARSAIPGPRSATNACASLNPAGQGSPALTAQEQHDYLKVAACMRSHGIPNFPDPTFPGGRVDLSIPSSIDTRSRQFTQAAQTCTKLIPAGLPYSRSGPGG